MRTGINTSNDIRSPGIFRRAVLIDDHTIDKLENEIEAFEKQLEELHTTILEASHKQDGLKIADLSQSIHNCQSAIDRRFDELETLVSNLETQRKVFAKKLQQLE